jgi:hypothetical protein
VKVTSKSKIHQVQPTGSTLPNKQKQHAIKAKQQQPAAKQGSRAHTNNSQIQNQTRKNHL